jgi:hypothetical protein
MKLILLLIINVLTIHGLDTDLTLSNLMFKADFNSNGIILSNYNNQNYINIKYETMYENNHDNDNNNNIKNIKFNIFNSDELDVYHAVISGMEDDTFYFEALNTMSYSIHNYEKNLLNVSLYVTGYEFKDINNEFIINLSFNSPINYDGEYYLELQDYIIVFSNKVFLDYENKTATVERFGNNFYLHFPSFKEFLLYDFIIYINI